jgi:hypothetical protein
MTPRLDIGKVFARVFETYRAQAAVVIPAAFIVFLPVSLVSGLAYEGGSGCSRSWLRRREWWAPCGCRAWWSAQVADIQDDHRDESVGSLFAKVRPVLGTVILAGILSSIGIVLGLLLLIVPGLVLLTWWSLIIPVIVLERTGVGRSFGRSREIVRGNGWRVFAIVVLLALLQGILGAILGSILGALVDAEAGRAAGELFINVLIGPLSAIAVAVVYFDLTRGGGAGAREDALDAWGTPQPLGGRDAPLHPPISGAPERPARPTHPPEE